MNSFIKQTAKQNSAPESGDERVFSVFVGKLMKFVCV